MSFNNLSLNIIEQVYLKLEPDDIANLCEINEKKFKDEFCQNPDFWERYFLYYRRPLPPKFDIFQYYSDQFYNLELVNKYFSFIDVDEERVKINEIYKLNYDSFKKLNLDFEDREVLREFFGNQGKEGEYSTMTILTFDRYKINPYIIYLEITEAPDEEGYFYDPYFDKKIDIDEKQLKELIKILLMANVKFLDPETDEEIEFED